MIKRTTAWARVLSIAVIGVGYCVGNETQADVIYVKCDPGPPNGDGLSWGSAFSNLHSGLAVCGLNVGDVGTEIWVSGTCRLASVRFISFVLPDDCAIYGGFNGTEILRDERDPNANTTILDGDINEDDPGNNSDNAYHVVQRWGIGGAETILDGFTIQNGNANGVSANNERGGGVLLVDGALTARNCTIRDNRATLTGGGIGLVGNASDLRLADCLITENYGFEGGAIGCKDQSKLDCFNTRIIGNTAFQGGAVTLFNAPQRYFTNTLVADNFANRTGGMHGGAFVLKGCTIVNNEATDNAFGGVRCGGTTIIDNTIIWGNFGNNGPPGSFGSQLGLSGGLTTVRYSDIQGGKNRIIQSFLDWGPEDDPDNPNTNIGDALQDADNPKFVDDTVLPVSQRDYRISSESLCIDAASNLRVPEDAVDLDGDGDTLERVPVDLAGVSRFWDDPATEPDPGEADDEHPFDITDMGAHEFVCSIVSDLPDGAIDARQPTSLDGSVIFGWDEISFTVDLGVAAELTVDSVTVDSTAGIPPGVQSVTVDGNVVTVTLDGPIPVGAWTRITLDSDLCSSGVCLGYLPGDVDGDGTSTPADILAVIDCLNGVATFPCSIWNTDIDRSGVAGPEDILRVIDLLNGAAAFDVWLDATLDASRCDNLGAPAGGGGSGGGGEPPKPFMPYEQPPEEPVVYVEGMLADGYLEMLTESKWSSVFSDTDIAVTVLVTTVEVAAQLNDGLINMIVSVLEDPATVYSHPVVAGLVDTLIMLLNTGSTGTPSASPLP